MVEGKKESKILSPAEVNKVVDRMQNSLDRVAAFVDMLYTQDAKTEGRILRVITKLESKNFVVNGGKMPVVTEPELEVIKMVIKGAIEKRV